MTLDIGRFQLDQFLRWLESNFFSGEPVRGYVLFQQPNDEGIIPVADNITVPDDHADIHAVVNFVDSEGNPTTATNAITWASDNENAATVAADEDGLGATVHFGAPGAAIISVVTTNNEGAEVRAQGTVTVVPGDVALGTVDFGEV